MMTNNTTLKHFSIRSIDYNVLAVIVKMETPSEFTYNQLKKWEDHLCAKMNIFIAQHHFPHLEGT